MKRYMALAVILMTSMSMMAQETYENTKLAETDLNGTAKYVGMGGALEALGADISTMGTNPAGIGLFRNSSISASMGLRNQQDAHTFSHGSKTQISFDQVGFVYASPNYDGTSFLNFGFTYRKSRDFNQIINASAALDNASQNKLSYQKLRNGVFRNITDLNYTQVDAFYVSNLLYDPVEDAYFYFPASSYQYNRAQEGYIGEYNINISGNINNRVFLGLTFGLHDVHYKHYSEYSEKFVPNEDMIEGLTMIDNRKVTGTGTDIKAGVVVRPVEESPFRIGAYVHTPTWYELITSNLTTLTDKSVSLTKNEEYKFKVYTPWKFGVSLGHTVGNSLALGATYEYTDYSTTSARIKDNDYYYSFMDRSYSYSHKDENMNKLTRSTLKGVSTLKIGGEFKPDPTLAVRLGYNYVSPMFDKNGSKDGTIASPGNYYESETCYVNWKDTHRITAGIGWAATKNLNLDVAYQYSTMKGDYYPFMNYYENGVSGAKSVEDNHCDAVSVSNNRHQILCTISYRF